MQMLWQVLSSKSLQLTNKVWHLDIHCLVLLLPWQKEIIAFILNLSMWPTKMHVRIVKPFVLEKFYEIYFHIHLQCQDLMYIFYLTAQSVSCIYIWRGGNTIHRIISVPPCDNKTCFRNSYIMQIPVSPHLSKCYVQ